MVNEHTFKSTYIWKILQLLQFDNVLFRQHAPVFAMEAPLAQVGQQPLRRLAQVLLKPRVGKGWWQQVLVAAFIRHAEEVQHATPRRSARQRATTRPRRRRSQGRMKGALMNGTRTGHQRG